MIGNCGHLIRRSRYYECIGKRRTRKNFLACPQRNEYATCHKGCTWLQRGRRYSGERRSMELHRIEYTDHREAQVRVASCAHRKGITNPDTKRTRRRLIEHSHVLITGRQETSCSDIEGTDLLLHFRIDAENVNIQSTILCDDIS